MSADFLLKAADVLEKAAAYFDAQETEKQAAVREERERTVKTVATKLAALTGDDLPEDILQKLAASDEDVLSTIHKLVEKTGSAVEALGGSGEKVAEVRPVTKKERAEAAYNSFGKFIIS